MQLVHLGDLELTLPLAAASGAWLLAARTWRAALAWAVLYAGAMALVGGSKIAYLGWGVGIATLDFKAFSGHAAGVTAVYPLVAYLVCRLAGRRFALAAAAGGLVLGAVMSVDLVRDGEHAVAEAAAGWLLGACASIGTLYQAEARESEARQAALQQAGLHGAGSEEAGLQRAGLQEAGLHIPAPDGAVLHQAEARRAGPPGVATGFLSAACAVGVFVVVATLMQSAHVGYWMIKVAMALSGNAPHAWDRCG